MVVGCDREPHPRDQDHWSGWGEDTLDSDPALGSDHVRDRNHPFDPLLAKGNGLPWRANTVIGAQEVQQKPGFRGQTPAGSGVGCTPFRMQRHEGGRPDKPQVAYRWGGGTGFISPNDAD